MEQANRGVVPGGEAASAEGRPRGNRGGDARGRTPWTRGRVLASLAVLVAGLLAFHSVVPNTVGNLGSLLETFLPWLGLAVPVLLGLALLRRSATGGGGRGAARGSLGRPLRRAAAAHRPWRRHTT